MRHSATRLIGVATVALAANIHAADRAEREMNVRAGPESVFPVAVAAIFPELENAQATGENGRVGDELVFWGYRLDDGREVQLVACFMLPDVDCGAREARVCTGGRETLARTTAQGIVSRRTCRSIALAAPGDRRPGCYDQDSSEELALSLLQCQ